jgi:phytoene dehydrogenase-like protein
MNGYKTTILYQLWEELGAVQNRQFVYADEYNRYEAKDGRTFTLYADIDHLEQHMLEIAPEDKKVIHEFCKAARGFVKLDMPFGKPHELMNLLDYLKLSGAILKYLPLMNWNRQTMIETMKRVKSPLIREAILNAWPGTFPAGSLLTTIAHLHKKAASYPIGGSLEFARAIEKRYLNLGSGLKYNARVAKILVENNKAIGVRLNDGTEIRADYVISAADMHTTIFDMLESKYIDDTIQRYFKQLTTYTAVIFIGMGINRKFNDIPAMVSSLRIELPQPVKIADRERTTIGLHVFNHDPTLAPTGKTSAVSAMPSSIEWWQNLHKDKNKYNAAKQEVVDKLIGLLNQRFPEIAGQIEMYDIATPVTFVRYTSNWKGSIQGWSATPKTWMMQFQKKLPGLENFWMCGQWLEPSRTFGKKCDSVHLPSR